MQDAAADVLLWCLSGDLRPGRLPPGGAGVSWQEVTGLACAQGVAPLFHKAVQNEGISSGIPPGVLAQTKRHYLATVAMNARLYRELRLVAAAFGERGIRPVALKGAHLAEAVYGDIGLRPMCDLDLLVECKDMPQAEKAMREVGYLPFLPHDLLWYQQEHFHLPYHKGAVSVELHWNLARPGQRLAGELEGILQRRHPCRLAGCDVDVMAPHDLLAYLCVHAACQHRFLQALRPLCDIAQCLRRLTGEIDWDCLSSLAQRARLGRPIGTCVLLAHRMLRAPLCSARYREMERLALPPEQLETIEQYILRGQDANRNLPEALRQAALARGAGNRILAVLRSLVPPIREMRRIYRLPPRSVRTPLYYAYRPLDLIHRKGRSLARLVLESASTKGALSHLRDQARIDEWMDQDETADGPAALEETRHLHGKQTMP